MKKVLIAMFVLAFAGISIAREHENLSTNILLPGGLPPVKGLYYTLGYGNADMAKSYDKHGHRVHDGNTVQSQSISNYFIWVPGWTLFGANFGMRAAIPFVDMDISQAPNTPRAYRDTVTGMADPMLMPLSLNWDFGRISVMTELAAFAPIGQYDSKKRVNIGHDHWTINPRLGSTVYFDDARTLTLSALLAYEYNLKNEDKNIEQGDQLWMQFAFAKRIQAVQLGLYGYASWKLEKDSGSDVNPLNPATDKDTVYALGPEMNVRLGSTTVTMKYLHEFLAENRATADIFRLSLSWRFF